MRGLKYLLPGILVFASCTRRPPPLPEAPGELLSSIDVADPRAAVQMVRGFWQIEGNEWRWTRKQFAAVLHPPDHSREKGARLQLKLSLPPAILQNLGPITLGAAVNGFPLPTELFAQAGDYLYTRDVPADAIDADAVLVEFTADKAAPPGPDTGDRELTLIAYRVSLTEK
jgi:hypothetical protein